MVIALVIVFILFCGLTNGRLLYAQNMSNLMLQNGYVLVLACGMLLCILTGGNIDLSVGAVICLVGGLAAVLISNKGMNPYLTIIICLVVGLLVGIWQGYWIGYKRIPPFITTLAGMFIFRGFGRLILDNKTVSIQNKDFLKVFTSYINIPGLDDTANYSALIVGIVVAVYVIFSVVRSRANKAKRGYRQNTAKAPISETLAAALIMLTPWRKDRILVDPFCGSGTFPIEAAMMAANMAPGMNRSFLSEAWLHLIPKKNWYDAVEEAQEQINLNIETDIQGYDIDAAVVHSARENARRAGVEELIHFQQRPVSELHHPKKYGFIITNTPYGERLEEKAELPALYRQIGESFDRLDTWSKYMITSYEDAQHYIGKKADKNRKIYNGMIKTYFNQYQGPKPPRREKN